ncbi:MAG: acyl-CoA/acyl-ACP dehydrogenase [Acidisphaera sp.]|nr:acyl-CoA/acyl-ACP dehydrogenase [Acidisphaera sp.]
MHEELAILRDSVAAWVDSGGGVRMLRAVRDRRDLPGFDPAIFAVMAELGWAGVLVAEEFGGSGLGFRGMGVLLEELGRHLVPAPLIGSAVAAASALDWSGRPPVKHRWLPGIAEGSAIAALAVDEGARHTPERIALRAERTGSRFAVSGTKVFVLDGMAADVFVVAARTDGSPDALFGVTLFAIPASAAGLGRAPIRLIDSRGYATLSLENVRLTEDDVVGEVDGGRALLDQVLDAARAAVAAEMLGLAVQAFDATLDYLRVRVQFGKPIGAFQALQHRAATMFGRILLTRCLVEDALDALDSDPATAGARVSAAKSAAGDLVNLVTREMVQLHGGIAMTEEHDAGLYLKRARVLEATLGSAAYHRERFAALCGF